MNIGQLLGGAGVVGRGMREAEEAARVAQQNQLKIEEQNRLNQLRQEMLRAPMPTAQVPQFAPGGELPVRYIEPAAAPAAPAAPAVPTSALPVQARPEAPDQSAVESARLARSGLAMGDRPYQSPVGFTPPAGMTGPQNMALLQQERLRRFAAPEVARQETAPMTEQERFAELQRKNTPAPQPTKRALSYDNRVTPYDAIIQQSAVQYGIDPVVFKRLIATESSFVPTAVSPRGEKFGLGIAQIAASHGLTREQMLDPNTAIPYAAQLFAKMIQQTGGDVEEALMRYKGASSEKGRAAMSKPIGDILSGLTPSATPAAAPGTAPAAPAPAVAPAPAAGEPFRAEVSGSSQFYLANPQSIPLEMQRAMQQRGEVERLAGMYQRAGMGAQFMEARAKLMELDNGMTYLQGMQGLQEFTLANDPRRLAAVWSQYAGVPIGIQPRTDGKFDIIVNGRKTKEGQSASEIADAARSGFDGTYRQQKGAASAKANEEQFKAQLDIQKENAKQLSQMVREIAVERVKGNTGQALEWAKANYNWDVKPTGAGDGTVIIRPPGGAPSIFNPSGREIVVDGVKITSNAAYPIAGLPTYGGVQMTR
jgi:soluble lytic murein transglycosylase-like protein